MSDPRFARLHSDPRFVRPKASRTKFTVDDRFKQLFEEGNPTGKKNKRERKVDKYGRPLEKDSSVNDLKRYYRLASPSAEEGEEGAVEAGLQEEDGSEEEGDEQEKAEESESEGEEEEEEERVAGPSDGGGLVDYARGAVLLESSDEEDAAEASDAESTSSSAEGSVTLGGRTARRRASRSPSIDLSETEPTAFPDEEDEADLQSEEEDDVDPTKRVALVNLDWDHLRASDLYRVLASSLSGSGSAPAPPPRKSKGKGKGDEDDVDDIKLSARLSIAPGRLLNVRIYPSQFGRERMEREAIEGPPAAVLRAKGADSSGDENDDDKTLKLGRKSKSREKARRRKMGGASDEEEFTAQDLVDEQVREGDEDYDTEALRKYQLERLRYYFAIATFDSASTAAHVVEQINGTEFERTANVFDMQYVPDDTSFEEDPVHDEATEASIASEGNSYQGLDFQTDALRHSKVKLTWDADDPHRKTKIQTYLAGVLDKSKQKGATKGRPKITEDDVAQYLASSTDEDDEEGDGAEEEEDDFFEAEQASEEESANGKKGKKVSKRERLRGLLGLAAGSDGKGADGGMEMSWDGEAAGGKKAKRAGGEGDMQITFAPALSERSAKQLDFTGDERPETSIERYKRKEKERKERKKAERKARLEGRLDENGEPALPPTTEAAAAGGDDAGFDDDFFADDGNDPFSAYDAGGVDSGDEIGPKKQSKKVATKLSKQERRAQREAEEKAAAEEQAKLGLLVDSEDEGDLLGADGAGEGSRHFDMRQVLKAEKNQGKKRKLKGKKAKQVAAEQDAVHDDFKIDTTDERFKNLHNDFDYAIDPSNPRYQKSRNMEALLAEGRKRRAEKNSKLREPVTATEDRPAKKRAVPSESNESLDKLVEAVKRKAGEAGGRGKRAKV